MTIGIVGTGHLAQVMGVCLAQHNIVRMQLIEEWVEEPGLDVRLARIAEMNITFVKDMRLDDCDMVILAEDTAVDRNDSAAYEALIDRYVGLIAGLDQQYTTVVLCSQVPVGTSLLLSVRANHRPIFYMPENLRRGSAVQRWMKPDRVVVGVPKFHWPAQQHDVARVLAPFTSNILWIPLEAAEMVKHAINSYLAVNITLANEIGDLCTKLGVNPLDVEAGLRSDMRVGHLVPVTYGGPITGGTLLRDVGYLARLAEVNEVETPVIKAIRPSNTSRLERA